MTKGKNKDLAIRIPSADLVPDDVRGLTLGDLLNDPDVEFRGGRGHLVLQKDFPEQRVTFTIDRKPDFTRIEGTKYAKNGSRDKRDEMIAEMVAKGRTQREAGEYFGLGQSRVSEILREQRAKKKK